MKHKVQLREIDFIFTSFLYLIELIFVFSIPSHFVEMLISRCDQLVCIHIQIFSYDILINKIEIISKKRVCYYASFTKMSCLLLYQPRNLYEFESKFTFKSLCLNSIIISRTCWYFFYSQQYRRCQFTTGTVRVGGEAEKKGGLCLFVVYVY